MAQARVCLKSYCNEVSCRGYDVPVSRVDLSTGGFNTHMCVIVKCTIAHFTVCLSRVSCE